MWALLYLAAQAGSADYSTSAVMERLKALHAANDTSVNAWITCADSTLRKIYSPREPARDIAMTAVNSCMAERRAYHSDIENGSVIDLGADRARTLADKIVAEAGDNLVNGYTENIMSIRARAR